MLQPALDSLASCNLELSLALLTVLSSYYFSRLSINFLLGVILHYQNILLYKPSVITKICWLVLALNSYFLMAVSEKRQAVLEKEIVNIRTLLLSHTPEGKILRMSKEISRLRSESRPQTKLKQYTNNWVQNIIRLIY